MRLVHIQFFLRHFLYMSVTNYAREKDRVFACESLLLEKNDKFSEKRAFSFRFETPVMPYESYSGINAEVR